MLPTFSALPSLLAEGVPGNTYTISQHGLEWIVGSLGGLFLILLGLLRYVFNQHRAAVADLIAQHKVSVADSINVHRTGVGDSISQLRNWVGDLISQHKLSVSESIHQHKDLLVRELQPIGRLKQQCDNLDGQVWRLQFVLMHLRPAPLEERIRQEPEVHLTIGNLDSVKDRRRQEGEV
jgi:hypothetical protein